MSARAAAGPAPTSAVFIAGTDTGVGKTFVARLLVHALARSGRRIAVMKPVAAGAVRTAEGLRNDDALALMGAANVDAAYECVNPYCLEIPASPHIAAHAAAVRIDIGRIVRCFEALAASADYVVVEGAGGWLAPVSESQSMADVARALGLPVLLVVGMKLGCLNHAQLTARAVRADGQALAAWIANGIDPGFAYANENLATLRRLLGCNPLAVLPHGLNAQAQAIAPVATERLLHLRRAASTPPSRA
jgi:dethiobiotin synthetase